MTWQTIRKLPGGTRSHQVSMSLRTAPMKGGYRAIYVYLGPQALAALEAKAHDKIRIERGTGEHAGLLRLSKSSHEGHAVNTPSNHGKGSASRYRIYFKAWEGVSLADQSSMPCDWRAAGHQMIEVTCPPWCDAERAATMTPRRRMP